MNARQQAKLTGRGVNQQALVDFLRAMRNAVRQNPVLVKHGAGSLTIKCGAFDFCVNGEMFTKAATDPLPNLTGAGTGAAQFAKLRIEIDAAGVVTYAQGGLSLTAPEAQLPTRTKDKVTIGWIEMPANFVPNVTAVDVANVVIHNGDEDTNANQLEA